MRASGVSGVRAKLFRRRRAHKKSLVRKAGFITLHSRTRFFISGEGKHGYSQQPGRGLLRRAVDDVRLRIRGGVCSEEGFFLRRPALPMRAVGFTVAGYCPPVPQLIGCLHHDAHIAGNGNRPHALTDDDGLLGGVDRVFGAGRIRVPIPFLVAGGFAVAQGR